MGRLRVGEIPPKIGGSDRLRAAALGIALLLVAFISALSYLNLQNEIDASRLVRHSQEIINEIGGLTSAIDDAESNQRGYLLTGDKSFHESYDRSIRGASESVVRLRGLLADDRAQTSRLDAFEPLLKERLALLAANLAYRTTTGLAALDSSSLLRGEQLMERIDRSLEEMSGSEGQLLLGRTAEA